MLHVLDKIAVVLFPDGSWAFVYSYLCGRDGIAPTTSSLLLLGLSVSLIYAGFILLLPSPKTLRKWMKWPRRKIRAEDYVQSSRTIKFVQAVIWGASFFWVMNAAVWFLTRVCAANNLEVSASYTAVAHQAFLYVVLCSVIWLLYRLVREDEYRSLLIKEEVLPSIHYALSGKLSEEEENRCYPAIRSVTAVSRAAKTELFDLWYDTKNDGGAIDGQKCLDVVLDVIYNDTHPYIWLTKRERQTMESVRNSLGR